MRTLLLLQFILLLFASPLLAQRECSSQTYLQQELLRDPLLKNEINRIENFVQNRMASRSGLAAKPQGAGAIVKIPVVVHILYHRPEENMSDEKVFSQLRILNESFRRLNADTLHTPVAFQSVAADCEIEFQLATSDPQRRSTTGIIRKYTPVTMWNPDDRMKLSAEAGDDDRDDFRIAFQRGLEHGAPVDARQPEVRHDDVEGELGQPRQGVFAVTGLLHDEAVIREPLRNSLPQRRLVVYEEQMFRVFSHLVVRRYFDTRNGRGQRMTASCRPTAARRPFR
jgi:hypothetical protein